MFNIMSSAHWAILRRADVGGHVHSEGTKNAWHESLQNIFSRSEQKSIISHAGETCKLSSEKKYDTMKYCLKGSEGGMVKLSFPEDVFSDSIYPKIMNLFSKFVKQNIQINFKIKYSFSNVIGAKNA